MFFPEESLKRGGRFYLCWVADSWPLRFAAITQKQLWSADIRIICHDLMEVINNESGRPTNRFSLRLSSQLMRGLVRLYEKKVTVLLSDLCMINAHVFKSTNKKLVPREAQPRTPRARLAVVAAVAAVAAPEEPRPGHRVEDLLQNSGNAVSNIQDITLKEATIPEFQLPPNDNFGEENPEQALQALLADRTIEMMLVDNNTTGCQVSGLEFIVEGDKSHDKSRVPHEAPQMEAVVELDATLFRKSTAGDVLPEFDKDVPEIPDIPALPVPSEPAPVTETRAPVPQIESAPREVAHIEAAQEHPPAAQIQPVDDQLEMALKKQFSLLSQSQELEAQAPQGKKRRVHAKPFIDKKIKLGTEFLRARVNNIHVELRCEDFTDAIIDIRVPYEMLLHRPATNGARLHSNISPHLHRMFQRNLGYTHAMPQRQFRTLEQETEQTRQRRTRSHLEKIVEVQEPQPQDVTVPDLNITIMPEVPTLEENLLNVTSKGPMDVSNVLNVPNVEENLLNVASKTSKGPMDVSNVLDVPNVEQVPMQVDISDLPTQKLETISQVAARKRASEVERYPKRRRSGVMTFSESQQQRNVPVPDIVVEEPDKENIPPNTRQASTRQSRSVSTMLLEAGLSEIQYPPPPPPPPTALEPLERESEAKRGSGSGSSETPLGSLDRTKVSLGDSPHTTDSQRFIRNQWGLEGTMTKIMSAVKAARTVTVTSLLERGPVLQDHRRIIAAKCFTSILKLKQHGFVRIIKDPETLEILDIALGPKFDDM